MHARTRTLALTAGLAIAAAAGAWLAFKAMRPAGPVAPVEGDGKPGETIPSIAAGPSPPPMLYAAFTAGGPIVTGLIAEVRMNEPAGPDATGELLLEIEEKLRGTDLPDTLQLPFDRRPPSPRRPPLAWDRVPPVVGRRLCVILAAQGEPRAARCVLDLDSEDRVLLPVLKRMLELEALPSGGSPTKLLDAVSDASPWVRALSTELLLARGGSEQAQTRRSLSAALARVARDPLRAIEERLQAVSLVGLKVYDGFSSVDAVNYEILSLLTSLLADPETRLRGAAAQLLHGYLLGVGTRRPSPEKIKIQERAQVLDQLKKDSEAPTYFAGQAAGLLKLLAKG